MSDFAHLPLRHCPDWSRLQPQVCAWAARQFPDQPLSGKEAHLRKELQELLDSNLKDPVEMSDCVLLMLQLADAQGVSLLEAILAKFRVNIARKWAKADTEGVHSHVKEETMTGPQAMIMAQAGGEASEWAGDFLSKRTTGSRPSIDRPGNEF